MKKYVMSLDQGTTSSRCIIFNHESQIISMAQKEFDQIYPNPGWVEHNSEQIWGSELTVIREALNNIGAKAEDIDSIGITNQRETTILWNKLTGEPVYNAIVWQCRRTADTIDEIKQSGFDKYIRQKTGLIPDAYFSATKIKWILENVPKARKLADEGNLLFGNVDTWLIWKLTGGTVHATDYTNASRTMLYDIHNLQWDKEILERFGIPAAILPKVLPSSGIFGYTAFEVFEARIPISGVAGDQQAAMFGQTCFNEGDVKNTYGTGCFLLMNIGKQAVESKNGLITTIAATYDLSKGIDYALEGSVFVGGAAIQWLRDEMKLIDNAAETESYAISVEDTNGVYIVPAFTGLGAPYWNQYAKGAVFGLTRGANKAHFIRATLESIAYQVYDVILAMQRDTGTEINVLKVDGGASANNFLMQFQSDILGVRVERPKVIETTALGAAYLAGLATGFFKDVEDIKNNQSIDRVFKPEMDRKLSEKKIGEWHNAVERC